MATVYAVPEAAPEPPDLGDYIGVGGSIQHYFDDLRAWEAKVVGVAFEFYPSGGDLQGFIYRYPVADGKASYLVARTRPLELWWLDEGDGYSLPEPHLRGLRVADLRAAKKQAEALADIFGGAKKGA
jgi:hypothetical protein